MSGPVDIHVRARQLQRFKNAHHDYPHSIITDNMLASAKLLAPDAWKKDTPDEDDWPPNWANDRSLKGYVSDHWARNMKAALKKAQEANGADAAEQDQDHDHDDDPRRRAAATRQEKGKDKDEAVDEAPVTTQTGLNRERHDHDGNAASGTTVTTSGPPTSSHLPTIASASANPGAFPALPTTASQTDTTDALPGAFLGTAPGSDVQGFIADMDSGPVGSNEASSHQQTAAQAQVQVQTQPRPRPHDSVRVQLDDQGLQLWQYFRRLRIMGKIRWVDKSR
ncbi:hypothetical protein LY76DRAFT_651138 [Colletotrichum caudatum]|nr:hypothetical protein LY76DRAFT_651138 [Colletotrichum caudatum]